MIILAARDHVFANKGIGAAGSGIFAACLERMVPQDADLVVRARLSQSACIWSLVLPCDLYIVA